jgi:tetratricopeptide (TPR) repeat protein
VRRACYIPNMGIISHNSKRIVAATLVVVMNSLPLGAQTAAADLLGQLKQVDESEAIKVERALELEWSKSGSTALDLLLRRGRDAMKDGEFPKAIEHFTALIDHAPDFAEGYHARATAFYSAGRFGPSIADLQRALELNPDNFNAIFGLGVIFVEIDDLQRAQSAFQSVLDLHPHHQDATDALKRLEREGIGRAL